RIRQGDSWAIDTKILPIVQPSFALGETCGGAIGRVSWVVAPSRDEGATTMSRERGGCRRRRAESGLRPVVERLESRMVPSHLLPGFSESLVTSGLSLPTSMAFAPDGRIFVTEQGGTLRVFQNGVLLPTPFLSLNVDSQGERGLLGIALDPNFETNGFVYVYYTTATAPTPHPASRFTATAHPATPAPR